MTYDYCEPTSEQIYAQEFRCLEGVTTCVGFDDILDLTLSLNHHHFDFLTVVTSHEDKATQKVCEKHSVNCVKTELFRKNNRKFNKGAAINVGMDHFQFHGWRLHFDCDIVLPDNFKRMLFNHTSLDRDCLYGADRVDLIGAGEIKKFLHARHALPQHAHLSGVSPVHGGQVHCPTPTASSARYVCKLRGYCPIGFFQLWHASQQRPYPHSLGSAAHDDIMFAQSWPESLRRLLPTVFCYHVSTTPPYYGQHWDGKRRAQRLVL